MIPDDEPWWMVRRSMASAIGDSLPSGTGKRQMPATYLSPGSDERDDRETEEPTDFRPFAYEW